MRSVLKTAPRCDRCYLPNRWCICGAHRDVTCPLAINVLMHHREGYRPSSTGNLINRVIPASRYHLWRRERQITGKDLRLPDRELWVLHPQGVLAPVELPPENVQVMLLDGSWRETAAMAQEVRGFGRLVTLPMAGESRYWLRAQADAARFSTVEALIFLLRAFGLISAAAELESQFELHVYASLRARGHKAQSKKFLPPPPTRPAFPYLLEQLNARGVREP